MELHTQDRRLNDTQAAQFCGVSVANLRRRRWLKQQPAFIRLGARVVYDVADLEAWMNQNRVLVPTAVA